MAEINNTADTNLENDLQILNQYAAKPEIFQFGEGNFALLDDYFNLTHKKITTIKNSIIPIIEVSLIDLLQTSAEYKRVSCQVVISHQGSSPIFDVALEYYIPKFIGVDIKQESIISDVNFIYDKLKSLGNVEWKRCSIDCKVGKLNIDFKI